MIIAIMQPTYLSWIGYYDMIDRVDKFVLYDDVQVVRRSWGVRNRIKTANGEQYLTVPVKHDKDRTNTLYCNARINYSEKWLKKHLKTIKFSYMKAPYFDEVFNFIKSFYEKEYSSLGAFNGSIIKNIAEKLGIKTSIINSAELERLKGSKDKRLVSVCKELNANSYLAAQGSADYIEADRPGGTFPENNINLFYHNYSHPEYQQLYGEFLSHMGIVDLLFNCGFDKSLTLIRSGRKDLIHYLEYRKNNLS